MKRTVFIFLISIGAIILFLLIQFALKSNKAIAPNSEQASQSINTDSLVNYGRSLISNTAYYFGPKGIIRPMSNGMNCQNCHLLAGTKPWGNSYLAVSTTYPRYRSRSASIETISHRINDCFERSLNGISIDSNSKEMRAIVAYMAYIGRNEKKGTKPEDAGLTSLPYIRRAASPAIGKKIYITICSSCHGNNGGGLLDVKTGRFLYPPLWGDSSYNDGAGLFRLSKFAAFVKWNMPLGLSSHDTAVLSTEEAWDVAAFVNSQPRPHFDQKDDWRNVSEKPADEPFGPYQDKFKESEHKYGPFAPIETARQRSKRNNIKKAL